MNRSTVRAMDPMSSKEENSSMSLIEKAAARLDKLEAQESARVAARAGATHSSTIEKAASAISATDSASSLNKGDQPGTHLEGRVTNGAGIAPPVATISPQHNPARGRSPSAGSYKSGAVPVARSNNLSARAQQARLKAAVDVRRGSVPVPRSGSVSTVAAPPPFCLLYTSPSPRDRTSARMPSSA